MTIRVLRAGVLATVQDLGRPGLQHLAIVPGGAMDAVSHRVANALVGNFGDAATLELALAGAHLEFSSDALIALHGARFEPRLDGAPMPTSRPVLVRAGSKLQVGRALQGMFGYLAVAGGIDVGPVLGSRSTYLPGAFGGLDGRALSAGAELPLLPGADALAQARFGRIAQRGRTVAVDGVAATSVRWCAGPLTLPAGDEAVVRVLEGVHAEWFDAASLQALISEPWRVATESNRMGYRLLGPPLTLAEPGQIASQAVGFGTVQVPPGGQPIVLMADRQTTGGYARIAEVVSADLGRMAQTAPGGAALRFEPVTLDQADQARAMLARQVGTILQKLRWEFGDEDD